MFCTGRYQPELSSRTAMRASVLCNVRACEDDRSHVNAGSQAGILTPRINLSGRLVGRRSVSQGVRNHCTPNRRNRSLWPNRLRMMGVALARERGTDERDES